APRYGGAAGIARVADAGVDERRRDARPRAARSGDAPAPARQAVPATDLRPPAIHPAEHLAAVRRLARRRARQLAAGASGGAGARLGDAGGRSVLPSVNARVGLAVSPSCRYWRGVGRGRSLSFVPTGRWVRQTVRPR